MSRRAADPRALALARGRLARGDGGARREALRGHRRAGRPARRGDRGDVAIGGGTASNACSWGHAGDGNLHATFLLAPGDAAQRTRADAAAREVFELALQLGGTVTGEHGIGVLKGGWLARQWAPAAVAAHRAIKRALDPKGLFNPGKKEP